MCGRPNLFEFMGEHWLLTLILAVIVGRPLGILLLAIAWRVLGK